MKNNKGFTLIELLIVVVMVGILAAIAIPQYRIYSAYHEAKDKGMTVAETVSEWQKTLDKAVVKAITTGKELKEAMKANKGEHGKIYIVTTATGSYVVKSGYKIEDGNIIARNKATNKEIIISPPYSIQEFEEKTTVEFTADPVTSVAEKEKKVEWGEW